MYGNTLMSDNINYKHLHYFWVVATEGSIARAAEKLFITPQTISGQLSMLEARIGQPLFDRIGRSESLKQKFYAISSERKVTHPAVAAICNAARDKIFK